MIADKESFIYIHLVEINSNKSIIKNDREVLLKTTN